MITGLSAAELARRIRAGRLSPVEVVEAHIARIEAVNPSVRAVVTPTFDAARREARAAAKALARGDAPGPLHGVPFTAKDSLDVAGVRSTTGLTARSDRVPDRDAAVVARMRAAGAILLGKTNTPDNCWNQETSNLIFGRTNNPLDLTRTVGGSTGGEAAIIAAGGSPLGLGTDIAGSIRMPAHFTGIVGLRPTSAALPEDGNWPPARGRLADLEAIGPMARCVEDAALAFDVLRGADPQPLDLDALRGAPVAAWLDDGLIPSSGAVRAAVRAAADALERAGMRRVAGAPSARRMAIVGWLAYQGDFERRALERAGMRRVAGAPSARRMAIVGWLAYQGDFERRAVAAGFGGGAAWSPLAELSRVLAGRPRVSPGALLYWLASSYGSQLTRALGVDGARWRERLRAQLHDLIGERGVAVCPIFPTTAPRHGWPKRALLLTLSYQAWVNLAGLPGLTVPIGRSGNGMPVGVQIVGAVGAERTILAAGRAVERALA